LTFYQLGALFNIGIGNYEVQVGLLGSLSPTFFGNINIQYFLVMSPKMRLHVRS